MDTIANFLTSIRNAQMASHSTVTVPAFKMGEAIAAILKEAGFVANISVEDKKLTLTLPQTGALKHIKRISKPGRRLYVEAGRIPTILGGKGLVILTTSEGVLSGKEAKKRNLGGELLCEVY